MFDVLKRGAGIATVLALLCAGCGEDHRTTIRSPSFLQANEVTRYPSGSALRSAAELVRLLEFNDATGAVRFFTPAWRLSAPTLARSLSGSLHGLVGLVGSNFTVTEVHHNGIHATISARLPALGSVVLVLTRQQGLWKLSRFRAGKLDLPRAPRRQPHRPPRGP